ncbi:hypothetical protein [Vreelandella andesensis]|nr:hypothetical protein [Halomonas andesensis]
MMLSAPSKKYRPFVAVHFVRSLIEQDKIPGDVTIQVLTQVPRL